MSGAQREWAVELSEVRVAPGAPTTRVTVRTAEFGFTFFARDVSGQWPIWIPHDGVAVTPDDDTRDYRQIAEELRGRGLPGGIERLAREPEENYENAAAHTRDVPCETWLGLSRDMRLFRAGFHPRDGHLGTFQAIFPVWIWKPGGPRLEFQILAGAARDAPSTSAGVLTRACCRSCSPSSATAE